MAVADTIVHRSVFGVRYRVLSVEVEVESVHAVPVAVVDSIVSRSVNGVCTDSTSGCGGQYCQ